MAKIACLGCGLVGEYVAKHLVEKGYSVTGVDLIDPKIDGVEFVRMDALEFVKNFDADVYVNLLPGRIGDEVRPTLIERGKKIVDLAFSAIDPSQYECKDASLLWDVGIAPGLSNILVAKAQRELGSLDEVTIKVGGNPRQPDDEWSYMAPFSPSDVIEEYTRPARIIRNGENVIVPALEDRHFIDVEGEKMEAFLTDGLRSLIDNIQAEKMAEYTVRWPGHIDKWLSYEGDEDELIKAWEFNSQIPEFTWLEVMCKSGDDVRRWIVSDSGSSDGSSMARTTGLVTAKCVILMAEDKLPLGVITPEELSPSCMNQIIEYLQINDVEITQHQQ